MKDIRIDIVSDVVCPWCIIGYKRLEKALNMLSDQIKADIHWHPFELNPHMPQGGENLRAHLAEKYGTTLDGSIKARSNLTLMGDELGFKFDYFDEMKIFNTFKAHQLLHYACEHNRQHELKMRLFSAFFGERKEIDQIKVLIKEAVAVGLDKNESQAVLKDEHYAESVRSEEKEWLSRGIQSVPTFVINNKYAISGAQEPKNLVDIILKSIK